MQLQYVNLTPSIPKRMDAHPYNVESLRVKGKKRVLVVLDHVPTEDLKTRKLMSGATGATIDNCCQYIDSVYSTKTVDRKDLDILFTPFNLWKTYHLAPDRQLEAEEFFAQNIRNLVSEYKPEYVMLCGPRPFQLLCPKETELAKGELLGFVGSSFNATFGTHRTRVVYNLSPNSLLGKNIDSGAYLLGYFARAWLPVFGTEFRIPAVRTGSKRNFKIIKVDTVKQFDAMLRDLRKRKRVSVDTETNGLRRIMVNMLTLQLCGDGKTAYVIPFDHADAKWSAKDHEYVKDKLRQFFEYDNSNDIHVYTNAKFDMSILRTSLGVRSFKNDIWDIIAGEFALDENGKNLATITGNWYYKLATISMAYGCRAYLTTAFGKQNRAMIKDVALTDDVLEYCSLDVIIPWHVVDQQMAKAAAHGYTKYCMMVRGHISDQIHSLAVLEHTGAPTDVDYLFSLSLPDSPINSLLSKTRGEFMEMPELRRAEKVLRKRGNIQSTGLFGDIKGRLFKLSSREHLQTLFFDVMGLSAPEDNFNDTPKLRPNGEPERKIGKSFQNMHKNNPVIKAFTEMSKLFKLRNAYVKSLIRMFGEDEDFRSTRRLRPSYNYDKIVTGRTSADTPRLGFSVGNPLSKAI